MMEEVVLICVVFLIAGAIKGTVGIGLPTVSVALMSQFIGPHDAVALVVFPLLISNLWQVFRSGAGLETLHKYGYLIAVLMVTLWLTTFVTVGISPDTLLTTIGVAIVIFAASSLVRMPPELPDRFDKPAQIIAGFSAGVIGGLTSIWSPPIVTYLIAKRTDNDEFVRAVGLFILLGGIPLAIGFWQTGLLNGETAPISALMIVPTLLGFSIGEVVRKRMGSGMFRTVLLWMFLLMGLNLLRQAFF
ncbi:sulfite exporter TauE/SafE family protein [Octadecabacter sp. G9-8]|uniref:Probable membrane transporter protein n=1 Tax=Octadecabacter dasysiphoniae TaxID=2909341 RepID=A0ABS9CZE6_9RHOB|nr:sulfite exporter TauE/SafE family protein [Octadecabacter dasysiphoniae]MCF2872650.1 sulfite exporter TauE/SafE family protein [Octadecabacter dasysiphoniae]